MKSLLICSLFSLSLLGPASAATVLFDDFSTDLGNWSTFGSAGLAGYDGGLQAAFVVRGTATGGTFGIINTNALLLSSYTDVNISFTGDNTTGAGSQHAVQFSNDSGSSWTTLSKLSYSTNNFNYTLSGTGAETLTSNAYIRVVKDISSNSGGGQLNIFSMTISGTAVPEPSALIFGSLGCLLLLRRRRG